MTIDTALTLLYVAIVTGFLIDFMFIVIPFSKF